MRRNQLAFVTIALCLGVLSGHRGWNVLSAESERSTTVNEQKAQSAARLKLMKETAARINVNVTGEGGAKLELGTEPIMRWDNHRSHILDAAAFLWFDRHRPQSIGAMWIKDGNAYFELHSLSPKPIRVSVNEIVRLSTTRPGTVWQAVPNAPAPAATRDPRPAAAANETNGGKLQRPRGQVASRLRRRLHLAHAADGPGDSPVLARCRGRWSDFCLRPGDRSGSLLDLRVASGK